MNSVDIKKMQQAVGAGADGFIGKDTLAAMFRKLGASAERAVELGLSANVHLRTAEILHSKLRLAHFLAQIAHESGNFRYMEEIASGALYEGRRDLGNTVRGDGVRYKGRGVLQLTGRANYKRYGEKLGIDLEQNPTLAANPSISMLVATTYWTNSELNQYADKDDIIVITRRINGGQNGIWDRKNKLALIKSWCN